MLLWDEKEAWRSIYNVCEAPNARAELWTLTCEDGPGYCYPRKLSYTWHIGYIIPVLLVKGGPLDLAGLT